MQDDGKPKEDRAETAAAMEASGQFQQGPPPDTTAEAMEADAAPTAEEAGQSPATCDHNWRRCPFYCLGCSKVFAISDQPVRFVRRIYSRHLAFDKPVSGISPNNDTFDITKWGDAAELVTELAGWGEGEEPPPWP